MDCPAHKENKVKSTQIIRKTNPESIATYLLIILPVTIFDDLVKSQKSDGTVKSSRCKLSFGKSRARGRANLPAGKQVFRNEAYLPVRRND